MAETLKRPSVRIHFENCKGCGRCVVSCPQGVLAMSDKINKYGYRVVEPGDLSLCTGCGLCYYSCPEPEAITVYKKSKQNPDA
ncbi:MAG: ATP-binding protein [Candidatus Sumerlaeia bacterium]